jgi:hypothetical protein
MAALPFCIALNGQEQASVDLWRSACRSLAGRFQIDPLAVTIHAELKGLTAVLPACCK